MNHQIRTFLLPGWLACAALVACAPAPQGDDTSADVSAPPGQALTAGCVWVGTTAVAVGAAGTADEYALSLPATSASHTSWAQTGNEALILEVLNASGLVGHLVLHQGADGFTYTMHLGALAAGETVSVRVSTLSAANATASACVGPATLTPASAMGTAAEGMLHAPIFKWPVKKRFDDLPVILGWSKTHQHYEAVYTNENGGTVAQCGGGASGIQAEIARWGRACDIEGLYNYGGTPQWERCTGMTNVTTGAPRFEAAHPIFYYGDGHNRLFESRGGYGATCGTSSDAKADGDITGWNVSNPGNDPSKDGPYVITVRPLPVDLDALGFASYSGRREGLVNQAPWLYRVTDSELKREGKIDNSKTFTMARYLFADVFASDVGGSGDQVCAFLGVSGGFKLRTVTSGGVTLSGYQMTQDYFGSTTNYKRVAIPLDRTYLPSEVGTFIFDAYDNDGIYLLGFGDAFMLSPQGDNGAALQSIHSGTRTYNVYVDDDSSSCSGGYNSGGPNGLKYPCVGSYYRFTP